MTENAEAKVFATKKYTVKNTKLSTVTLEQRTVKKKTYGDGYTHYAYDFAVYKGKRKLKQKLKYSDSFHAYDANAFATVTVIGHSSSPSLIILTKQHNGWPFVDGVYSIVNGNLKKVKIKGDLGSFAFRYIGKNQIASKYYNRFLDKSYVYNSTFNAKTNTLTSKVVKTN